MLGSDRSPARKSARKCLSPSPSAAFLKYSLSGSSLRIALSAVGAVNMVVTLCSLTTLQKVEASGVPTGFPSNNTVVAPANNGA